MSKDRSDHTPAPAATSRAEIDAFLSHVNTLGPGLNPASAAASSLRSTPP